MILLYGGGGEPGAGEIPMDLFRKQAPDVFPVRGVSWTNSRINSYYDSMVASVQNHSKIPSFMAKSSGKAKDIELEWI